MNAPFLGYACGSYFSEFLEQLEMSERTVLIQHVSYERTLPPAGRRIWSDGLVQRTADGNPLPGSTESLERDRELKWEDERQINEEQLETIRVAIRESGFFALPPRVTINYCKEDPGTTIWTVTLDGQTGRVVVYDPRPKRSKEIDLLIKTLKEVLG
jgi:hypothetical protein